MSFSPALKWFVLLLLPVTFIWKVAVRTGEPSGTKERDVEREVVDFLSRHDFAVVSANAIKEGQPSVQATSGACRMLLAKSPPVGWDRDLIRRYATAGDRVFVVYRGTLYSEQPTWLTVSDYLWSRFKRELGINAQPGTVLAVIASRACNPQRLPWNELK